MHEFLTVILFGIATFVIGALAVIVVVWIARGTIDLTFLIADEAGDASMSRFQLLIFTFIVAIGLVKVLATSSGLPDIPTSILVLIGVSGSTYAIGKAVNSSPADEASAPAPAGNTPPQTH
jgi:hypothetical protein